MSNLTLASVSNELAELVSAGARSVVQVHGGRRPVSGVVHGPDTIVATARGIGRDDGLRVSVPGGAPGEPDVTIDADLAGWDPPSGIVVLRTRGPVNLKPPAVAEGEPRPGEIVLAIARSWSNAVTASAGIVAVVGGPLRTGRRREIARVIRITAPMHDGFAGGAVFDTAGRLTGIATSSTIRGLGVVIPGSIAWRAAEHVLTEGTPRRGFIGVAVQPVELPASQRPAGHQAGLVVVAVTPAGPAEAAGVIVGDVLLELDGRPTRTADDLLDLLTDRRVARPVTARILRGGEVRDVQITVADRQR